VEIATAVQSVEVEKENMENLHTEIYAGYTG